MVKIFLVVLFSLPIVFILVRVLRIIHDRRRTIKTPKAVINELALLEADLPHDFLKLARAEATQKIRDKKRKRVEQIYLENPALLE